MPDALLDAKYLRFLSPLEKSRFVGKLTQSLLTKYAERFGEQEAKELTKVTALSMLKKGAFGFGAEFTQEYAEDVINDTVAKFTYNPNLTAKDILIPTKEKLKGYAAAGISGALGGGVEAATEASANHSDANIDSSIKDAANGLDVSTEPALAENTPVQTVPAETTTQPETAVGRKVKLQNGAIGEVVKETGNNLIVDFNDGRSRRQISKRKAEFVDETIDPTVAPPSEVSAPPRAPVAAAETPRIPLTANIFTSERGKKINFEDVEDFVVKNNSSVSLSQIQREFGVSYSDADKIAEKIKQMMGDGAIRNAAADTVAPPSSGTTKVSPAPETATTDNRNVLKQDFAPPTAPEIQPAAAPAETSAPAAPTPAEKPKPSFEVRRETRLKELGYTVPEINHMTGAEKQEIIDQSTTETSATNMPPAVQSTEISTAVPSASVAETQARTPAAESQLPSPKNLSRNFRVGTNDATLTFDSERQRDFYDLAAKEKYQMRGGQNSASDRAVGDIDALKKKLVDSGIKESDLPRLSREVFDDVKAQMKGVKHLEERKVSDNVLPKPSAPASEPAAENSKGVPAESAPKAKTEVAEQSPEKTADTDDAKPLAPHEQTWDEFAGISPTLKPFGNEPYELTGPAAEISKSERGKTTFKTINELEEFVTAKHKEVVGKALAEGKTVPAEILEDYPDVVKKNKERQTAAENGDAQFTLPGAPADSPADFRRQETILTRQLNRYSQSDFSDEQLVKNANVEVRDGDLMLNAPAVELFRRILGKTTGEKHPAFFGAYLPPSKAFDLSSQAFVMRRHGMKDFDAIAKMRDIEKKINEASNNSHKDLIAVVDSKSAPLVTKYGHQEEKGHRADYRARDFTKAEFSSFEDVAGYKEAREKVRRDYPDASSSALHNEVIAKTFRDDAETVLGINQKQVRDIQDHYAIMLLESGKTPEEIVEAFEQISETGKEFSQNVRQSNNRNNIENGQGRSNTSDVTDEGNSEIRQRKYDSDSQSSGQNESKLANVQRTGILERTRSADELTESQTDTETLTSRPGGNATLLASNGKRSNLTPQQHRQTRTPEFKKWFGDSKVVDSNGEPLIVYHGTRRDADFETFNTKDAVYQLGSHFGSAEQTEKATLPLRDTPKGGSSRTIPVFLNIQNPLRLEDAGAWGDKAVNQLQSKGLISKAEEKRLLKQSASLTLLDDAANRAYTENVQSAIKKAGYDGIVYENYYEGGGDSYIAFEPNQIKSAVGNNGNFDSANNSILFSRPTSEEADPDEVQENTNKTLEKVLSYIYDGKRDVSLPETGVNLARSGVLAAYSVVRTNLYGNTMNQLSEQGSRPFAALTDILLAYGTNKTKGQRSMTGLSGRAIASGIAGSRGALRKGLKDSYRVLTKGMTDAELEKFDQKNEAGEGKDVNPAFIRNTGIVPLDAAMELVKRISGAVDKPFRAFAEETERYNAAKVRALNAKRKANLEKTEYDFKQEMRSLARNPSEQMEERAEQYGSYATFQDKNIVSTAVEKFRRSLIDDEKLIAFAGSRSKAQMLKILTYPLHAASGIAVPFSTTPFSVWEKNLDYFPPTGALKAAYAFYRIGKGTARTEWAEKSTAHREQFLNKMDKQRGIKDKAKYTANLKEIWESEDAQADAYFTEQEAANFTRVAGHFGLGTTLSSLTILGLVYGLVQIIGSDKDDDDKRKNARRDAGILPESIGIGGYRFQVLSQHSAGRTILAVTNLLEQFQRKGTGSQKVIAAGSQLRQDLMEGNPYTDAIFSDKFKGKDWKESLARKAAMPIPRIVEEIGETLDERPRKVYGQGVLAPFMHKIPFLREMLPESELTEAEMSQRDTFGKRLVSTLSPIKFAKESKSQSTLPTTALGSKKEQLINLANNLKAKRESGEDISKQVSSLVQSGELEERDANKVMEIVNRRMSAKAMEIREAKSPAKAVSVFRSANDEEKEELLPYLIEKAQKAKTEAMQQMYVKAINSYRGVKK